MYNFFNIKIFSCLEKYKLAQIDIYSYKKKSWVRATVMVLGQIPISKQTDSFHLQKAHERDESPGNWNRGLCCIFYVDQPLLTSRIVLTWISLAIETKLTETRQSDTLIVAHLTIWDKNWSWTRQICLVHGLRSLMLFLAL